MRKNKLAFAVLSFMTTVAVAQTPVISSETKSAAPVALPAPVTTITGAKIAPVGGAITPGSEVTLMDIGALDRQAEINKRLEAISKSNAQRAINNAPPVAPVQAIAPKVEPEVKKKSPPAGKTLNPGVRLKAIYGVGNNLSATFVLPGDQLVERKVGQDIDGWTVQGFALGGVTLAMKKQTTFLRLDAPYMPPAPVPTNGIATGSFSANGNGNAVMNAPLPNPNMNNGQLATTSR